MVDLKAIEEKWKKKWADERVFEVAAKQEQKKFFGTFPYPYMNGFLHMGHFYSVMRLEIFSRYKRLQGHNTLFAQGWHCTGSPIEAAAKRVREKEPKQIESMKKQGFSDEEIQKFGEPKYWTDFFPEKSKEDYLNLGMSVDFRRSFITTDLNPHYNKFIEWQFRKLQEKEYVVKGKHPVVWDPIENTPVGDHDRIEGEGETPKDFIWAKFRMKDSDHIIMAGTTRPDALFGQTHLWVDPDGKYKLVQVGEEKWIVGEEAIQKIEDQHSKVNILGDVPVSDLIGKWAQGPLVDYPMYIIPAWFIDSNVGSGIVYSALEDPVDLVEMQHIQSDDSIVEKYNLDKDVVAKLQPISIIQVPGMSNNLGQDMIDKYKITSPKEKKKIKNAKDELNREVFRKGVMKNNCGKYAGMKVPDAQIAINKDLTSAGDAVMFYELTGKVVARSLSECIVKVVEDQWFMNYADMDWKKLAHECLDSMKLYPEKSRQQFNYVIDWLQNWACVREVGLGTKLPWDDKWVIESLSDSTIYMAYYTIAHLLQNEDVEKIDDSVFDYIFLDGDKPDKKIDKLDEMKKEFEYWYPMDFRNSGKDLIQNHLTFSIFNHIAIFPKEKWPQSFGVNGWVTVDGQKMSKSLGNFIMLKDLAKDYSVDSARITIMSGGEGLDDPNWDSAFAKSMNGKLEQFHTFCLEHYNKGVDLTSNADKWMEAQLNLIIKECTGFMEETMFRSALQKSFFELQRVMKNYVSKTDGNYNIDIMNKSIEAATIMISPAAPFLTEEIWEALGNEGFVCDSKWPEYDEAKIDLKAIFLDEIVGHTKKDIATVQKLAKVEKLSKVSLIIADDWKYDLVKIVKERLSETRNPGDIIQKVMGTDLKQYSKDITKIVPRLIKNPSQIPQVLLSKEDEVKAIKEVAESIANDFGCELEVIESGSTDAKAGQAMPGRPAIVVE